MMNLEDMTGPNRLATQIADALPQLIAERDAETVNGQRKQLSSRIKASRTLLKWCRSRSGYDTSMAAKRMTRQRKDWRAKG